MTDSSEKKPETTEVDEVEAKTVKPGQSPNETGPEQAEGEIGGPEGPEPTRYGDWEVGGRCTDF
ncbi:MAG: hypothetical protein Alpg2KO_15570 [Alphaproteobacteria bacterium]